MDHHWSNIDHPIVLLLQKSKSPMEFDEEFVKRQMKYNGIMEIVQARKHGFTHRLTFADFLRR